MHLPIHDDRAMRQTVYSKTGGVGLGLPSLVGEHSADIVIVGGGIGGCSAALHAAEGGASVILLEANQIGWGASSRNSGHVPPATKHDPDEIIARYGSTAGQRL